MWKELRACHVSNGRVHMNHFVAQNVYMSDFGTMGEGSKIPKSRIFEISILKLAVSLQNIDNFKFKWSVVFK